MGVEEMEMPVGTDLNLGVKNPFLSYFVYFATICVPFELALDYGELGESQKSSVNQSRTEEAWWRTFCKVQETVFESLDFDSQLSRT